ncbi:MAG: riboflavin kinase, partial [Mycobacteriales bacterium]
RRVEAFVLDFDGDLYGEQVALDFVARLRGMEKFDDVAQLQAQMAQDVALTRSLVT